MNLGFVGGDRRCPPTSMTGHLVPQVGHRCPEIQSSLVGKWWRTKALLPLPGVRLAPPRTGCAALGKPLTSLSLGLLGHEIRQHNTHKSYNWGLAQTADLSKLASSFLE